MSSFTARLGPFALDTVLDSGGMGSVWRGRHAAQNVAVAYEVELARVANEPVRAERALAIARDQRSRLG